MSKSLLKHPAFQPMVVAWPLRALIGLRSTTARRQEVIKKLWLYIMRNNLRDNKDKRSINCDEGMQYVFGKKEMSMFEMTKLVSKHMTFPKSHAKRLKLLRKLNVQRTELRATLKQIRDLEQ
jgi:chromatin remodeling complex protein RSC6